MTPDINTTTPGRIVSGFQVQTVLMTPERIRAAWGVACPKRDALSAQEVAALAAYLQGCLDSTEPPAFVLPAVNAPQMVLRP